MEKDNSSFPLNSISEVHRLFDLPKPLHPLISLMNNLDNQIDLTRLPQHHVLHFYKISYKTKLTGKLRYGQGYYDFEEGGLLFAAPNQLLCNVEEIGEHAGYTLLIHPDFFLDHSLSKKIREYGFFSYTANEALHLSDNEKETILSIFRFMEAELHSRIDDFSQGVMLTQIELLLNYAERFYKRQFITRKGVRLACCAWKQSRPGHWI